MQPTDLHTDTESPESDYGSEVSEPPTEAQRKRLVMKSDLVIMPLAIVCMTIAFLDKVTAEGSPRYCIIAITLTTRSFRTLWVMRLC